MMKNTPLTAIHIEMGAKMTDFAGYNMPVYYSSIIDEHQYVRKNVGIFDVSHMGEFIVKGKEAIQLVDFVSSNNASRLKIGQAQYSCLPNTHGGIVDDLLVYRLPEDRCAEGENAIMLVVNASNIHKDWEWINSLNKFDAEIINISEQTGLLAVQGPNAINLLQKYCNENLSEIPYYHFIKSNFAGIENVLISATGYTGSGGFELYVQIDQLTKLWSVLFDDKEFSAKAIGLGARDTLRLEMGYCLYGNDINDETSPLEAGLGWITKTKKASDFMSKDIFTQQRKDGLNKKLIGFTVNDRRVPRKDYLILNKQEREIGKVTSGTLSPSLGIPIGLGYVSLDYIAEGTQIVIQAGKKMLQAEVVKVPFYKEGI